MAAQLSVPGLMQSSSPYRRSAKAWFPLHIITEKCLGPQCFLGIKSTTASELHMYGEPRISSDSNKCVSIRHTEDSGNIIKLVQKEAPSGCSA